MDAASLRAGMPDREADWNDVVQAASVHLVLPTLYCALRDKDMLAQVPEDFGAALEGFHDLNALRNARLRQQMQDLSSLMNGIGVTPVWLKGASNLLRPDWQGSPRIMFDLDFWVPDAGAHAAVLDCLGRAGYAIPDQFRGASDAGHHHFLPRACPDSAAHIELHKNLVSVGTQPLLRDQDALARVEWLAWNGKQIGRLAAPDGLMQSYIQCAEMSGGALVSGRLRLMKALDFVERALAMQGAVPAEILAKLDRQPWRANARRFFSFLEQCFGLQSALPRDGRYLRRVELAMDHPRTAHALYVMEFTYSLIRTGRAGPVRGWWPKLVRHLRRP